MFFDDRLETVLRHRADGQTVARTQYRQLLDLLGNRKYGEDNSLIAAAWLRLSALAEIIGERERAAIVREESWHIRSPELTAFLAQDGPRVAAAALKRADLAAEDWTTLIPRLPIRARGFLRLRESLPEDARALLKQLGVQDRGLPRPASYKPAADTDEPAVSLETAEAGTAPAMRAPGSAGAQADSFTPSQRGGAAREASPPGSSPPQSGDISSRFGRDDGRRDDGSRDDEHRDDGRRDGGRRDEEQRKIAEILERIALFRREHPDPSDSSDTDPRLPLDESSAHAGVPLQSISFASDTAGRIEWADPDAAAMVIGKRLMARRPLGSKQLADPIARAFFDRVPIEGAQFNLEGAPRITGDWIVDAQPRFASEGHHFQGYIGVLRRPSPLEAEAQDSEAERIRQLLHELRTPVNALQGFAEIIQQQMLGPAPNEYRALAATIAGDAARILAGFDELERLARLQSGAIALPEGRADLHEILHQSMQQLQGVLAARMAEFVMEEPVCEPIIVATQRLDLETMIWRIMATLAGSSSAAETLSITIQTRQASAYVLWDCPTHLMAEEDIFTASSPPNHSGLSASLFGAGFALRLAQAEAASLGGSLRFEDEMLCLDLPLLTAFDSDPSP